jgi:hypothetical protein
VKGSSKPSQLAGPCYLPFTPLHFFNALVIVSSVLGNGDEVHVTYQVRSWFADLAVASAA